MEKQGDGGAAYFSMIGSPVCMMLLVHCEVSSVFSLWFLRRVGQSVYDKRLGNDH